MQDKYKDKEVRAFLISIFEKRFGLKLYDANHSFSTEDIGAKPTSKGTYTRVELKQTLTEEQEYAGYSLHNKDILVYSDFAPDNILVYVTNVTYDFSRGRSKKQINSELCHRLIDVLNPKLNRLENLPVPASFKEKDSLFNNSYRSFLLRYRGYIEAYMDYFSLGSYHVADGAFSQFSNSFRNKEVYNFTTRFSALEKLNELFEEIEEPGKYYVDDFGNEFVNKDENEILNIMSEHGHYDDFPKRRLVMYRSLEAETPVENYGKSVAKKSDKPSEATIKKLQTDLDFDLDELF